MERHRKLCVENLKNLQVLVDAGPLGTRVVSLADPRVKFIRDIEATSDLLKAYPISRATALASSRRRAV